ncbi:class I SAM-dependent DNA methyltransferase [Frankia sp. Mgl5]|uniref:Eco57I restriction-modification methylase domain-containing protein n=1 Tax=Frankia sp. Mgl5 TaxID=2933793 RepID=UPI00200C6A3B|nr:class I SAM-dependent DNA methyltransferase [Frankia sp. Mgl5]MCK9926964.1 class I SAM-dependent DNA methyltransferase [Frankia sp. Mgl5]
MPSFDAVVVGESWISEHYLTSEARTGSFLAEVLALRVQWKADEDDGHPTARSALRDAATPLARLFGGLGEQPADEDVREVHREIRRALRLDREPTSWVSDRSGDEVRLPAAVVHPSPTGTALLILEATPAGAVEDILTTPDAAGPRVGQLLDPAVVDGKPQAAVAKVVSSVFLTDDAPPFVLVQAGRWVLLAERSRWPEGRWLAVDLGVVVDRRDVRAAGELEHVAAMVGPDLLLPGEDGVAPWLGLLEKSVQHTVGVSADLREGVRLSVEIIANEVVARRRAAGLDVLDVANLGRDLTRQSLRFLYRILFLLYAEASPQLEVLPVQAPEYQAGYGLDRLRDLILTDLSSDRARRGRHLYESLHRLFVLVDKGHTTETDTSAGTDTGTGTDSAAPAGDGLVFQPLRSDLFAADATALIDEVGLGNEALQRVLRHLLLTKVKKGSDRGFISYGELGINQLGAVYEGLMSWSGIIADTDLYEVAKGGDPSGGTWLLPAERVNEVPADSFVLDRDENTGEPKPRLHPRGSFVYRLAGRERQQSASYYTPEVLTRSVVHHAIEELLDQDGTKTRAADILAMTICEPALGSGAFAIEAVRQLAAAYLSRAQDERGERIPAEQYPAELQRVKAYLALHQVYGVDLNATAVELAEVSLWLDTMQAGLAAPWFGLHLRRGNSLIGARRAVYAPALLKKKEWLTTVPTDVPLHDPELPAGSVPPVGAGIHHFLLPAAGWGAVVDTAEAKAYAPEARERLRAWRAGVLRTPGKEQQNRMARLAQRVEVLWELSRRRLEIAEAGIRRATPVWGADGSAEPPREPVTREQVELVLNDPNSAYRRLRRAMDAWCALWSWPLTTEIPPPDMDTWLTGLEALLGKATKPGRQEKNGQSTFADDLSWAGLDDAEELDLTFAAATPADEALRDIPWLKVAAEISDRQGFFHWELDFPQVFTRGGFDLQVGNPPWVRPDWDEAGILAEYDPWWTLVPTAAEREKKERRKSNFHLVGAATWYLDRRTEQAGYSAHLGSAAERPRLHGLHPDLYRCFMDHTWRSTSPIGITSLIHPESHFIELRASNLRSEAYTRLRRHWQYRNEHKLFNEINNTRTYGIHVYGSPRPRVAFIQAAWLYDPSTAERSLRHDGSGPEPGIKDGAGKWDISPHSRRIMNINLDTLRGWRDLLEIPATPPHSARAIFPVNQSSAAVLQKISAAPRILDDQILWTRGWEEDRDRRIGRFERRPATPSGWADVVIQGPQFSVGAPLSAQPNKTAKSNVDYEHLNPENIPEDFIPRTIYQRSQPGPEFHGAYPRWNGRPSNDFYRLAWRKRVDSATVRSLHAALIPPGPTHVNQVHTLTLPDIKDLVVAAGIRFALTSDFFVKSAGITDMTVSVFSKLPHIRGHALEPELTLRTLRLNCLVRPYAPLWKELYSPEWQQDRWAPKVGVVCRERAEVGEVSVEWGFGTPLRRAADRRQALVEIDAIVAVMLGLTADELVTVYRTQFPVLQDYERKARYDSFGRQLPADLAKQLDKATAAGERVHTLNGPDRTYVGPFSGVNRETDLRIAHEHFSRLTAEREAKKAQGQAEEQLPG